MSRESQSLAHRKRKNQPQTSKSFGLVSPTCWVCGLKKRLRLTRLTKQPLPLRIETSKVKKEPAADPASKKRKSEWAAGCKKLEGDCTFVKDRAGEMMPGSEHSRGPNAHFGFRNF